jgi:hypothetical protein
MEGCRSRAMVQSLGSKGWRDADLGASLLWAFPRRHSEDIYQGWPRLKGDASCVGLVRSVASFS